MKAPMSPDSESTLGRRTRLACGACGQEWETGRAPGHDVRCPSCEAVQRVPVPDAGVKRSVSCGACGVTFETSQRPGRKARCRCGEAVRVPVPRQDERADMARARAEASEPASSGSAASASWRARANATVDGASPSGAQPLGEFRTDDAARASLGGALHFGFGSANANLLAGLFLLPIGLALAWLGAWIWGTVVTSLACLSLIRALRLRVADQSPR